MNIQSLLWMNKNPCRSVRLTSDYHQITMNIQSLLWIFTAKNFWKLITIHYHQITIRLPSDYHQTAMNIYDHPWTSVTKVCSFRFKTLVPGSHTDLRESVACHSACTGRTEWGPICLFFNYIICIYIYILYSAIYIITDISRYLYL